MQPMSNIEEVKIGDAVADEAPLSDFRQVDETRRRGGRWWDLDCDDAESDESLTDESV